MRIYCHCEVDFLSFHDFFQITIPHLSMSMGYKISRTGQLLTERRYPVVLYMICPSYINSSSPRSSACVTSAMLTVNWSFCRTFNHWLILQYRPRPSLNPRFRPSKPVSSQCAWFFHCFLTRSYSKSYQLVRAFSLPVRTVFPPLASGCSPISAS